MIKYGLLVNEKNQNLGDDIQSYAEAQFLPRVDVLVDREQLNTFKYKDGKDPVALIMGAWFMWKKWNWPPSKQIFPLNVAYHHYERPEDILQARSYAVPIFREHYDTVGGDWFKAYGKVGCRDLHTCKVLDEVGIPNYFSGCVTLTLPKQKKTKDNGTYICIVDVDKKAIEKIKKMVGNKYEIKIMTQKTPIIDGASWEERSKRAEEYLTIYQNAKYVVTRRLHVALPCLAMEVPVMVIQAPEMNDPYRFDPYKDWLHFSSVEDFLEKGYDEFDFINGTPNKKDYVETRKELTKMIKEYVAYCEKNKNKPLEFFDKTTYTEEDLLKYQNKLMSNALENVHVETRKLYNAYHGKFTYADRHPILKKIYKSTIDKTKLKNSKLVKKLKKKLK